MMMRNSLYILVLFVFVSLSSFGQTITNAEYYFDTEPGIGNGEALTINASNEVNQSFDIAINELSTGFHTLYIRVQDENNTWGLYDKRTFFISELFTPNPINNIVEAAYYFDSEPGIGNGTALAISNSGTEINETYTLDISSLSVGFHFLYIRVKNADDVWSLYDKRVFYISEPFSDNSSLPIVTAEYFFDAEPGIGNGTSLTFTSSNTINEAFSIDVSSLSKGFHTLYVRVKNEADIWSLYDKRVFYISEPFSSNLSPIVAAEYFFNTEPGNGNGTPLTIPSTTNDEFMFELPIAALEDGDHLLYIRVQNQEGIWSIYDTVSFEIIDSTITWNGSNSTDWNTATNWTPSALPISTSNAVIPSAPTNQPIISATTGADAYDLTIDAGASLTVNGGGSLIVNGTSTGNITYEVAVADTNWHLVSSPVVGEQYDDAWVTANSIASGTGSNRGVAPYNNSMVQPWEYFQAGASAITFDSGVGYSALRTAVGDYSFTGTYPATDVSPTISQNDQNWNLIGNPYPSYIDVAAFITANISNLPEEFRTIYVWDGTSPTTGNYTMLTTGYIHPGQGFFVNSNIADGNASITEAMQSHQTGVPFYRTTNPSIHLTLSDGTSSKETQINYLEGKTLGLDPGFDLGMFNGTSSNLRVFTHLIEDNEGIAFSRQALPNSDYESMIVPVGVKADAGKEITFSAQALNLPTDTKVFLEDKVTNTFVRLDEANTEYTITLSEDLDGIGRFYLHTSESALTTNNIALSTVHVYKSDISTVRIAGLPQGNTTVRIFNILGKEILNTSFKENGVKDISLSKFAVGIYIVKVQTEIGKMNKKIVLE